MRGNTVGIFSDIGRSNAFQVGQSVFRDAMAVGQQERQGIVDAVTLKNQQDQLAIQQAHEARAAEAHAAQQAALNQFIPVTLLLGSETNWTPAKRKFVDDLKTARILEDRAGVPGITARNAPLIKQYADETPEQHANWMALSIGEKAQEIGALKDKIFAERNPEKLDALQAELAEKSSKFSALTDRHQRVIETMPKVLEARAIAATKLAPKIVADEDSPTKWSYQDLNTGEMTQGAPPPRDYDADTRYRSKTLAEQIRHNMAIEKKAGGVLDLEGAKGLIRTLPKLKEEAVSASGNLQRIDEMNALLDKGFGGKAGQIKAWLAPWAEAAGMDVKGLSEAQTYELLAQTLGGSMRMAIVGPGQVSNYEQQMLQRVNAGGRAATPAARELLKYYRDIAARKVNDYNDSVDSVAEVSPQTAKIYKRIAVGGVSAPAAGGSVTTAEEFLQKKGLR